MPDGLSTHYLAKPGERRYCFIGLWESEEKLIAAHPDMIEHLNSVREFLEELSPGLGVTDGFWTFRRSKYWDKKRCSHKMQSSGLN